MSDTPETDKILSLITLANHPETDGEHFRAFMESVRNGVEALERDRDALKADKLRLMLDNASWESTCTRLDAELHLERHSVKELQAEVAKLAILEREHYQTANTFMAQVKALQADKRRIDLIQENYTDTEFISSGEFGEGQLREEIDRLLK